MLMVVLWEIVGAGLVGLVATGMAAHALVRAARKMGGQPESLASAAENSSCGQELERLREENRDLEYKLVGEQNNSKTLQDLLEKEKKDGEDRRKKELEEQENRIRQDFQGLDAEKKELEEQVRGLKVQKAEADAVKACIAEVAPYVYSYGEWYHAQAKSAESGGATSALWRICQASQEVRGRVLDVLRHAEGTDRKQMYVQAAQLYETAYRQNPDAATLAEVQENVGELLASLERGEAPLYGLYWPEVGGRWVENNAKRLEDNGQATIQAVVRPVVLDLTNRTVFSLGIVKTGG